MERPELSIDTAGIGGLSDLRKNANLLYQLTGPTVPYILSI